MGVDLARGAWRTVRASVAGTSHAASGQPCGDSSSVRVLGARGKNPLLVAVVADGAGSADRAGEGARLACTTVVAQAEVWVRRGSRRRTVASFGRADATAWVDAARRRIDEAARSEGRESRDFSCTLLVALVDARSAAFFQIGDGAIVYRGAEGGYRPALWPQSGEYANCTFFVTDDTVSERVQAAAAEDVHEVALLSDGLQSLALRLDRREVHGPFFEPMFARLRQRQRTRPHAGDLDHELRVFLDSPPVNQRTDDDKTLILATRLRSVDGSAAMSGGAG